MVNPIDRARLGIDLSDLVGRYEVSGIGGTDWCAIEEAYLAFTEPDTGKVWYYNVDMLISRRGAEETRRLPSLLGRDILHRWRMFYFGHSDERSLTFEVISDDLSLL